MKAVRVRVFVTFFLLFSWLANVALDGVSVLADFCFLFSIFLGIYMEYSSREGRKRHGWIRERRRMGVCIIAISGLGDASLPFPPRISHPGRVEQRGYPSLLGLNIRQ